MLVFRKTHDSSKKIIFHEFNYTFSIMMTVYSSREDVFSEHLMVSFRHV